MSEKIISFPVRLVHKATAESSAEAKTPVANPEIIEFCTILLESAKLGMFTGVAVALALSESGVSTNWVDVTSNFSLLAAIVLLKQDFVDELAAIAETPQ